MDMFVSCVVGRDSFRKNVTNKPISQVVTVTDEAMAFLFFKNSFKLWTELGEEMRAGGGKKN
jgi:hypothetical protein